MQQVMAVKVTESSRVLYTCANMRRLSWHCSSYRRRECGSSKRSGVSLERIENCRRNPLWHSSLQGSTMGHGPTGNVCSVDAHRSSEQLLLSFLAHVLAESIKGRASASTPTTTASRGLVTSLLIATTAALLARFGQVPLLILVSEEHKNQLLMFLLALIWLALAVMAPIGAGLSSVFAIENAHVLVDRWAGERPIYDFLAVVAGLGMFAFTGYLVYAGYMYGALTATKMGIWPWPTNG